MQPAPVQPPPSPTSAATAAGPQHAFSVGGVLSRTFSTWSRHLVAFSILTVLAAAPFVLLAIFGDTPIPGLTAPPQSPLDAAAGAPPPQLPQGFWLAYLASMLLFVVEVGAITHGVIHHLAGKRVSLGAMIGAGLRRAIPLLVVGVLSYLAVSVGMVLLLVPGVIVACSLAVAIPAVVVERPGVFGALRRSSALTKGKRLAILAVFLVLGVIAVAVSLAGSMVLPALTGSFAPMLGTVLGLVVNVVFGTLFWVAPGVVYHDLRVAKEGVATAQLAAVFE
ncbi:MAG TPA: hypothetical protein VFL83_03715 [Anaeromyxobacter sp.]|nr:hypothetical protein [Anaeromyxobacter sp.]